MREILFRGKTLTNKGWVYGLLTDIGIDEKESIVFISGIMVHKNTVGQFTGLTDKNGTKIFEGDIIKNEHRKGQYQYFKVIYDERTYRWEVENKYGMLGQLCFVFGECEVIGNIHDNPELLKGGEG